MGAKENIELATDTAEALLTAIKEAAGSDPSIASVGSLAQAYALVRESMPKPTGSASRIL